MALTQMRVVIGDLRVELYLVSNGTIAFVPGFGFTTIYDGSKDGITAVFDPHGFSLQEPGKEAQHFDYQVSYEYKTIPVMLAWLIQQNL